MKKIYLALAVLMIFTSCEKVIQLDLKNTESRIVIDGSITNEAGPYTVKITQSVNMNQPNVFPPVTNAQVIITDNAGQRDTLNYISDGNYRTRNLLGIAGRTYTLAVTVNGKIYTASSTMPSLVNLDSLRVISSSFAGETQINIVPVYTDPVFLGNNYRFIQYVNGEQDKAYVVFNDDVNNGMVNQRPIRTNDLEIAKGDLVRVSMFCIDLNAYNYYYTLGELEGGGPGGGTTPSNPPNNISGGALGIFSAHTVQSKTIRIQ